MGLPLQVAEIDQMVGFECQEVVQRLLAGGHGRHLGHSLGQVLKLSHDCAVDSQDGFNDRLPHEEILLMALDSVYRIDDQC